MKGAKMLPPGTMLNRCLTPWSEMQASVVLETALYEAWTVGCPEGVLTLLAYAPATLPAGK